MDLNILGLARLASSTKIRVLEKGEHHKIEQAVIPLPHNPRVGDASSTQVTTFVFDPKYIHLFPLFSQGMDRVKEHWPLNPGACMAFVENMAQYLDNFRRMFPNQAIVAATNGNNLFSNALDILVRTQDGAQETFTSQQPPDGERTCFVVGLDGNIGIKTLLVKDGTISCPADSMQAIFGQHTVTHAQAVNLANTGIYKLFSGNYTHLFKLPRFISPERGYSLSVEPVEKCGAYIGVDQMVQDPALAAAAIRGERVTFALPRYLTKRRFTKPEEPYSIISREQILAAHENGTPVPGLMETIQLTPELIFAALLQSGYTENDFELDMGARQISIKRIIRSRYPLTMIGHTDNGIALTATFDGTPFVSGPTVEEAASIMAAIGAQEALALGNGSEVAMYGAASHQLVNTRTPSLGKGGSGNALEDAATVTANVYYYPSIEARLRPLREFSRLFQRTGEIDSLCATSIHLPNGTVSPLFEALEAYRGRVANDKDFSGAIDAATHTFLLLESLERIASSADFSERGIKGLGSASNTIASLSAVYHNISEPDKAVLWIGALLHDIGKATGNREKHPATGYTLLQNNPSLLQAIRQTLSSFLSDHQTDEALLLIGQIIAQHDLVSGLGITRDRNIFNCDKGMDARQLKMITLINFCDIDAQGEKGIFTADKVTTFWNTYQSLLAILEGKEQAGPSGTIWWGTERLLAWTKGDARSDAREDILRILAEEIFDPAAREKLLGALGKLDLFDDMFNLATRINNPRAAIKFLRWIINKAQEYNAVTITSDVNLLYRAELAAQLTSAAIEERLDSALQIEISGAPGTGNTLRFSI